MSRTFIAVAAKKEDLFYERRPIPGFENYHIDERGYVFSPNKRSPLTPCKMKRGGYLMVNLWRDGKGHSRYVHQLVAYAFRGPKPHPKMHAAHRDGNKYNNHRSNIEWITRAENEMDKRLHGTSNLGERNHFAKLSDEQCRRIKELGADGLQHKYIAALYDISISHVRNVIHGRRRIGC